MPAKPQPIVAGFEIPEHLRFHQGHAWALGESPNLVRAGIDDFAAKLIGEAEEVNLPQRGQWIRQGQKVWSFRVNGELVEMVSPIEGTVSDVNDEVVRHPETLTADPYGNGWLMTVQSPDAKTNYRNLLSGNMARNLMADSAQKLAEYMPAAHGGWPGARRRQGARRDRQADSGRQVRRDHQRVLPAQHLQGKDGRKIGRLSTSPGGKGNPSGIFAFGADPGLYVVCSPVLAANSPAKVGYRALPNKAPLPEN